MTPIYNHSREPDGAEEIHQIRRLLPWVVSLTAPVVSR